MAVPRQKIAYLVAGDTAPDFPVRFEGLDLADYSSITMEILYSDDTTASLTVTPDGTDDELGHVAWSSGDLPVGSHRLEFKLTQVSDSKVLTLPRRFSVILEVRADLT